MGTAVYSSPEDGLGAGVANVSSSSWGVAGVTVIGPNCFGKTVQKANSATRHWGFRDATRAFGALLVALGRSGHPPPLPLRWPNSGSLRSLVTSSIRKYADELFDAPLLLIWAFGGVHECSQAGTSGFATEV
jgi:hypothetical protein